jgi:hypothetical protein
MEVHTAIESIELEADGTIKRCKFWNKLEAIKILARVQEIAGTQEPVVAAGPVTTVTNVYLEGCTTEEIRVLRRVAERFEARKALTTEYPNNTLPEDRPVIDVPPVNANGNGNGNGHEG